MKRLLLLLSTVVIAGCSLATTEVADIPSDPTTETYNPALNIDLTKFTRTTNGVYYRDLTVGTGATLTGTPTVQFTYAGLLTNGTIFDQQVNYIAPLAGLVYGLQEGLQGMQVGGERMVIVPSELGYGNSTGLPIPPNSTILFDVQLTGLP